LKRFPIALLYRRHNDGSHYGEFRTLLHLFSAKYSSGSGEEAAPITHANANGVVCCASRRSSLYFCLSCVFLMRSSSRPCTRWDQVVGSATSPSEHCTLVLSHSYLLLLRRSLSRSTHSCCWQPSSWSSSSVPVCGFRRMILVVLL
jgi:hypothetical protein